MQTSSSLIPLQLSDLLNVLFKSLVIHGKINGVINARKI